MGTPLSGRRSRLNGTSATLTLGPRDSPCRGQTAHLRTNLCTFGQGVEGTPTISRRKPKKRVYPRIKITRWIPHPLYPEEGRKPQTMCGLQTSQQHHDQKSISTTEHSRIAGPALQRKDFHEARSQRSLQPDPDEGRGRMEDRVSNTLRTLRIPRHAIWTHQRTSDLSRTHQQRSSEIP